MTPSGPACIVTSRDTLVRLYAHPSVEHGRPWCALADVAGLVGYPQEDRQAVADGWRSAHPDMAVIAGDGAVIVSDAVVLGFVQCWRVLGWTQRSALADALVRRGSIRDRSELLRYSSTARHTPKMMRSCLCL